MRKIVLFLHTGFSGMESHEYWEVPETTTDEELSELCWSRAKDNAEMYAVYPYSEYCEEPDFDEEDESYSENIEGSFEDYDADTHDGHRQFGDITWMSY